MSNFRQPDVVTVLVTRVDGGVTIMRVITAEYGPDGQGGRRQQWAVEPTPEYIDSVIAKHNWTGGLAPVSWELVDNTIVHEATDRTFRNVWKRNGKNIETDMPKARDIHRNRIREARARKFDLLDAEYLRADEDGDTQKKNEIRAKKNELRNLPSDAAIDAAQTPAELKAFWPTILD